MLLLRDELKLDNEKVQEVFSDLNYKINKNDEHSKDYKFIEYILKKVTDNQKNDKGIIANEIMLPKYLLDGRMDLRSLPTISIDYVKYANNVNMLFDDAFSFEEKEDGTYYLWMHIPDVDEVIPRDGELDRYMHNRCESIYVKDNKEPMIPYAIAKKISLIKDEERLALSFRIHVDSLGNILGINYFKTVIKVDQNYSKSRADLITINRESYNDERQLLEKMAHVCKMLRLNRHGTIGKRTKAGIIMDEYNIWANIVTAMYFEKNGIVFPYKNFVGDDFSNKYISDMRTFLHENKVDEDSRNLLYELVEAKSRPFYSTTNYGNAHINGLPYSCIGNPLREYISLETDRLIKDLVISKLDNLDEWTERINNDCVELSEVSSKVKELYRTSY
jgi:exoribonuclease R